MRTLVVLAVSFVATVVAAPAWAGGGHDDGARHSLRAPVTGESFYFVMADRFENGSTANDHGGLPAGKTAGESGFDPTAQAAGTTAATCKGLLDRIDYIRGLGTTAIWLTPSFKNKAVQDNNGSRRPATTATGSPTSRRSTRTSAPTTSCAALVDDAHRAG